jgi:lipoprotein NlpI
LDIYIQLAKANPSASTYRLEIAMTARTLEKLYRDTQREKEANRAHLQALEAFAEYQVALKPDSAETHEQLGEVLWAKGDQGEAVTEYQKAIVLKPDFAEAHYNLARVYMAQGKNDEAIRDFDQAIRFKPDYVDALANRGIVYEKKGEYDRAIQDLDHAIRLKPDYTAVLFVRGNTNFYLARFPNASADYQQSLNLNPSQPYAVLWLHLARKHLGEDDGEDLVQRAAKLDSTQWPGPVLKFYLGQMTADELIASASSPDSEKDKGQHCEATFYVAEHALLQHDHVRAMAGFQTARDICPKNYVEYAGAVVELKGLESGAASLPRR